jgi:hypothetical protein
VKLRNRDTRLGGDYMERYAPPILFGSEGKCHSNNTL